MDEGNWDPNALLVCPYDKVHVIAAQRFQRHLLKCRKNHPSKDVVTCPFNAKHLILRDNFRQHVSVCENKLQSDEIVKYNFPTTPSVRLGGQQGGYVSMPPTKQIDDDNGENWDQEISESSSQQRFLHKPNRIVHQHPYSDAAYQPPINKGHNPNQFSCVIAAGRGRSNVIRNCDVIPNDVIPNDVIRKNVGRGQLKRVIHIYQKRLGGGSQG